MRQKCTQEIREKVPRAKETETSRTAVPRKSPLSSSNIPAGNSKISLPTGTLTFTLELLSLVNTSSSFYIYSSVLYMRILFKIRNVINEVESRSPRNLPVQSAQHMSRLLRLKGPAPQQLVLLRTQCLEPSQILT